MQDASDIPLVDLRPQHAAVAPAVAAAWERIAARSQYILGPELAAFEAAFAAHLGAAHCVGVGNGTDALEFALRALGVGPGDEVLLPANACLATAFAIVRAGARPVAVDVDPDALLVDPAAAARRVGPRTRALVAVSLYGQLPPMERLAGLAGSAGLVLVEDIAQAHGARQHGRAAGTFGAAAGCSFYPTKNLGAWGDAGAVVTDSDAVATRVRQLRNYGGERRNEHVAAGFNSRLDELQAAVLRVKLAHLETWNEERIAAARRYDALLAPLPAVRRPHVLPGNRHVFHLYVVRVPDRDRVLAGLRAAGVQAAVHYPAPVHLVPALAALGDGPGTCPVAERAAGEVLSLPLFPGITPAQQERVAAALARALARSAPAEVSRAPAHP